MIDGLGRFHLDHAEQLSATVALQHEVRKPWGRPPYRRILFIAGVDGDVEFPFIFRLQQANDAVVLELLPDWPDEDWAHTTSDVCAHEDDAGKIRPSKSAEA